MLEIQLYLNKSSGNKLLEYSVEVYEKNIKTTILRLESFKFDEIIRQLLQYLKDRNHKSGVRLTLNYNISNIDIFYINHAETLPIKELIIDTSRMQDCKIGVLGISFKGLTKLKLVNLNICNSIFIPNEGDPYLIQILDCSIEKMTINGGFYCMATNSSISYLQYEGGDEGGTFDFYNIKITVFNIINGRGVNLDLSDTLIGSGRIFDSTINKVEFKKADLGTLSFSQVTFSKPLSIERTSLSKVGLVGINWSPGILSDTNIALEDIQSSYQQLKHNMDQIGNKTEANKFFAKEMEYYEKSLSWKSDWDKKFISMLQRYSNNYGNSWILPLGWIFILSGLYTSLHLFSNIQASHCWHGFCFHVAPYGVFFNEVIKNINVLDDFKNIDNAGIFLYRIFIAFFIYQFIVALRRISQR